MASESNLTIKFDESRLVSTGDSSTIHRFNPRHRFNILKKLERITSESDFKNNFGSIINKFIPSITAASIVSTKVLYKKIDSSFTCAISKVDFEKRCIEARVYDNSDDILIMEIETPFDNFEKSDVELIKENAVFYWTVGTRTIELKHSNGKVKKTTENFSEFKLRRIYTSNLILKNDIENLTKKYSEFFGNSSRCE